MERGNKTLVIGGVGSKARHSNIYLPVPNVHELKLPLLLPNHPHPTLLLGISGMQLKGPLVSIGRLGSGSGESEEVNSPRG